MVTDVRDTSKQGAKVHVQLKLYRAGRINKRKDGERWWNLRMGWAEWESCTTELKKAIKKLLKQKLPRKGVFARIVFQLGSLDVNRSQFISIKRYFRCIREIL